MAFLTFYNSFNEWLFIQIKCPYSIDVHNQIVQISKIRTIFILMSILLFEIIVNLFGNMDSHIFYTYCSGKVCANSGFLVVALMIHSQLIITILSFLIRKKQMQLLQRIAEFDKCVASSLNSAINVDQLKRRFLFSYSIFCIYNGLIFLAYRILEEEAELNTLILSFSYFIADVCFTAVILNMCVYGYFFNHRYNALIDRLKVIVRNTNHINRTHFSEVSILYFSLFDLQMKFSKIFGLILVYTFLFHWTVHTRVIYVAIFSIRIDPKISISVVFQMIIFILPYTVRIGLIVTIFAPIGQQVVASPANLPNKIHKSIFGFQISRIRKVVGKINVPCDQPIAYCVRIVRNI